MAPGPGDRVVIVGASLAGIRTAETLRDRGFAGTITLIGSETEHPYDRPPLSKQLLSGAWEPNRIRSAKHFGERDIEMCASSQPTQPLMCFPARRRL